MRKIAMISRFVALFLCIAASWSCTSSSNSPSGVVKSLKVSGDTTLTATDDSQFSAQAVMSDGSTEDVSLRAAWTSSNTVVAIVGPSGIVTAKTDGVVNISATYQGASGTVKTTVSPLVVFAIGGTVIETGFGGIPGAKVQVLDGPSAGLSTTTDGSGNYVLPGIRAGVKFNLQTSLDGFNSDQRAMTLSKDTLVNISLVRTPPDGATARCKDKSWSFASDRTKACVGIPGGVAYWVCPGPLC
jgi:hypothetical protein